MSAALCFASVCRTRSQGLQRVAAMADRASKLRRIEKLRRNLPHVTASALSALLEAIASEPIDDTYSRRDIREARDEVITQDTPYGSLFTTVSLPAINGCNMEFDVINPFAMLHTCFLTCAGMRALMKRALLVQPWRLVMYCDEVTPGNQLAPDNLRKMWVFYFSFLEFGAAALSQEDAWFCISVMRTSRVKLLYGGVTTAFSALLKVLFTGTDASLHTTGVRLRTADGNSVRLFARLEMILQDGGAHKLVWMAKGDAGSKFCLLCRNLYLEKSDIAGEDGDNLLVCNIIHERELDFATNDDIRGSVRRLAAHSLTDNAGMFKFHQSTLAQPVISKCIYVCI